MKLFDRFFIFVMFHYLTHNINSIYITISTYCILFFISFRYFGWMRVKELSRWVESFGLPDAPWSAEPNADWATALNLLSRLLHRKLSERYFFRNLYVMSSEFFKKVHFPNIKILEMFGRKWVIIPLNIGHLFRAESEERRMNDKVSDEAEREAEGRRRTSSQSQQHPSTHLPFQQVHFKANFRSTIWDLVGKSFKISIPGYPKGGEIWKLVKGRKSV